MLTIGPNGKIRAEVFAKQVIVLGEVTGNVTASEKVDIRDNGSVDGDVTVAARGHCRRRALPRRHRHAARRAEAARKAASRPRTARRRRRRRRPAAAGRQRGSRASKAGA